MDVSESEYRPFISPGILSLMLTLGNALHRRLKLSSRLPGSLVGGILGFVWYWSVSSAVPHGSRWEDTTRGWSSTVRCLVNLMFPALVFSSHLPS